MWDKLYVGGIVSTGQAAVEPLRGAALTLEAQPEPDTEPAGDAEIVLSLEGLIDRLA